ncbi:hemolysin family protein [Serinibacter salmoneus]|uniref:CBS domain containing-hemolysin-like protein n=1 Tax=Serinibacter salmoneus TaxID=556530 RepID=A0A2A9CW33_9MICO|nr:hemolysin family protein [Serinibacter salmoneus]PFG18634.1 CBS domain containing-hemolysin-like protein [Serinibacter salmoneus]
MSIWTTLAITAALILASAFFVVIEFALLGARRHRLEAMAPTDRAARSALRAMNELTIMLAVAQLGITACTFALGAITEPAVHHLLSPVLDEWGLPYWLADGIAFALALGVVTFLHLVVGEMTPKSWAIAHPELAARLVGPPARALAWLFRPILVMVNAMANWLVARAGVEPVERAAVGGRDAETIRQLVEYSGQVGSLEPRLQSQISQVMDLQKQTVGDLTRPGYPTSVAHGATVADVRREATRTGHLRILVRDDADRATGVVHVRDILVANDADLARDFVRAPLVLPADLTVYEGLSQMQAASVQLAVVDHPEGTRVVTLADVIRRVLPIGAQGRSGN